MDINKLADAVNLLKDTPRKGWILRMVQNPESVADHSWAMCLLILILCPENLNKLKCLEFAVVHDLAESITGDYVPSDNIDKGTKYQMEYQAVKQISEQTNCPRLLELFCEYERRDTPEAVFVKKMDKLEVVLQAKYYDNHNRSRFFEQKREWQSLFEEYESNARPVLGDLLKNLQNL